MAAIVPGMEPGSRGGRLEGRELDRMAEVGAGEVPGSALIGQLDVEMFGRLLMPALVLGELMLHCINL